MKKEEPMRTKKSSVAAATATEQSEPQFELNNNITAKYEVANQDIVDPDEEQLVLDIAMTAKNVRAEILCGIRDAITTDKALVLWHALDSLMSSTCADEFTPYEVAVQISATGNSLLGLSDLLGLQGDAMIATPNWRTHYEYLRNLAQRRMLLRISTTLANRTRNLDVQPGETASYAIDRCIEVVSGSEKPEERIGKLVHDVNEDVRELRERGSSAQIGISSGIKALDELILGWQPGHLVTLGGGTGVGKTTTALNFACSAAKAGETVVYCTVEMTPEEIAEKVLSLTSRVALTRIRTGNVDDGMTKDLENSEAFLRGQDFYVIDARGVTVAAISSRARGILRGRSGLIVIDYLQLLAPEEVNGKASRYESVSQITRSLKIMAGNLGVPVIALSQLNRSSNFREGGSLSLSDLRDSGSIEQDSDEVILLKRDGREMVISVKKSRFGGLGDVTVGFDGATGRLVAFKR